MTCGASDLDIGDEIYAVHVRNTVPLSYCRDLIENDF